MKYEAAIDVMPLKELLDPQGKAAMSGLKNLGLSDVQDVRIGKHITLTVEAKDENEARAQVKTACKKLLCNPVIEGFEFTLQQTA